MDVEEADGWISDYARLLDAIGRGRSRMTADLAWFKHQILMLLALCMTCICILPSLTSPLSLFSDVDGLPSHILGGRPHRSRTC